ncbi:hypothetical protein PCASD_10380 [Puccinia coronata f. sp. avenae]|uniref:Pantothenate kinase n=1 Tax=Puccinia coronata f. sp. avenae TaxID=200324 RepID=A0A2N5URR1_9BASI|nr:hypothetical protein PCASD_10380 [Puccinia coronata f. sp. avenae]
METFRFRSCGVSDHGFGDPAARDPEGPVMGVVQDSARNTRTSWNQQGSSTATMSHRHLPASTSTLRVDIRGAEILDENESIETSDIYLPKHTEFISHIALDIGGSLAKVVYFTRAVDLEAPRENHPKPSGGVTSHQASASQQELHSSGRSRVEQPSRSSSPQSSSSNDPEPSNLSNSLPHSSARSSVSQPNGILHPTVVREELYNSRARSLDPTNPQVTCNPSADLPDHPTTRGNDAEHSQLTNKLTSLSNVKPQAPFRNPKERLSRSSSISSIPGGRLNFIKFEPTRSNQNVFTFISNLIQLVGRVQQSPHLNDEARGQDHLDWRWAYMYADFIKTALGGDVEVLSEDEMDCLITGLNFITEIPNEVFWFSDQLVQEIIHNNPTDPKNRRNSPPPPDPSFDDPSAAIEQFPETLAQSTTILGPVRL